jgi:hypothetical protein
MSRSLGTYYICISTIIYVKYMNIYPIEVHIYKTKMDDFRTLCKEH